MEGQDERKRPKRVWRVSWATRILAPLALIAVLAATYVIVSSAGDEDGGAEPAKSRTAQEHGGGGSKKGGDGGDEEKQERTYVIKSGDSLSAIAAKFDVTVDDLLRWNADSDLDPEALVAGDVLKIR